MTEDKLQRANIIQARIETIAKWLEKDRPDLHYGPVDSFAGTRMLSESTQRQIRAIAKEDAERQLSQLRQEFEAL